MFRDAYLRELEVLHGLSDELAARYPELASMLGRDADPETSRLLQRLAFAFAHVRQRTHDDLPEVIHAIFEDLAPCMLQPVPCATLIELQPNPKTQRGAVDVEIGATFAARHSTGSSGTFVATEACEVRPWVLRHAEVVGPERRAIRLGLELLPGTTLARAVGTDEIVLSLTSEQLESALDLRGILVRHAREVRARCGSIQVVLVESVRGVARVPLAIGRPSTHRAMALSSMRDYFTAPQVFCRVSLGGAQKLAALGEGARAFEIFIELDQAVPARIIVDTSALRLHCVPAISLASVEARVEATATGRYALRSEHTGDRLVAVERVELVDGGASRRVARWTPAAVTRSLEEGDGPLMFEVHRDAAAVGDKTDLSVSFLNENGTVPLAPGATARARVLVTNVEASNLALGEICRATESSPVTMRFRNVTSVSRGCAPVFANDRLWELLHFMKLGMPALADRRCLARLLALLNLPSWFEWPRAKPSATTFEPLLSIAVVASKHVDAGEVCAGLALTLDVDAGAFLCEGDVHLFGELVGDILRSDLEAHEWLEHTLRCARWPAIDYPRRFGGS